VLRNCWASTAQFAKVTPQYERIASSNAVILVFKIEEAESGGSIARNHITVA